MSAPGWPAMMKRATAAAYCDLSVPSFVREVAAGRLPSGVMLGNREHWHRETLDRALAAIAGNGMDDAEAILRRMYGEAA